MSFFDKLHSDPAVRDYLFKAGESLLGGEMIQDVHIDDAQIFARQVWLACEEYHRTKTLPSPEFVVPDELKNELDKE